MNLVSCSFCARRADLWVLPPQHLFSFPLLQPPPLHAVLVFPSTRAPCLFQAKMWGPVSLLANQTVSWEFEWWDPVTQGLREVGADGLTTAHSAGQVFQGWFPGSTCRWNADLTSCLLCGHIAWLLMRNLYQALECVLVSSEKGKWYIGSVYN